MDNISLKEYILSLPELAEMVDKCPGIVAEILNQKNQKAVRARNISVVTVLNELPDDGIEILNALQSGASGSDASWIFYLLTSSFGLDIGSSVIQKLIDSAVSFGPLTSEYGDKLKSLAVQDVSIADINGFDSLDALTITNLVK